MRRDFDRLTEDRKVFDQAYQLRSMHCGQDTTWIFIITLKASRFCMTVARLQCVHSSAASNRTSTRHASNIKPDWTVFDHPVSHDFRSGREGALEASKCLSRPQMQYSPQSQESKWSQGRRFPTSFAVKIYPKQSASNGFNKYISMMLIVRSTLIEARFSPFLPYIEGMVKSSMTISHIQSPSSSCPTCGAYVEEAGKFMPSKLIESKFIKPANGSAAGPAA